jgi:hypothetical protein
VLPPSRIAACLQGLQPQPFPGASQ